MLQSMEGLVPCCCLGNRCLSPIWLCLASSSALLLLLVNCPPACTCKLLPTVCLPTMRLQAAGCILSLLGWCPSCCRRQLGGLAAGCTGGPLWRPTVPSDQAVLLGRCVEFDYVMVVPCALKSCSLFRIPSHSSREVRVACLWGCQVGYALGCSGAQFNRPAVPHCWRIA